MQIVPWKPFGEISRLRREMDDLWQRFFGQRPFYEPAPMEWAPSVDISETDNDIIVEAELPGVEPADVHVDLTGDVLTIKGEKKKQTEEKGQGLYRSERYYGSYERSFRLPAKVNEDKIEAAFDKGILKIKLPKVEEAKKKIIEIKVK